MIEQITTNDAPLRKQLYFWLPLQRVERIMKGYIYVLFVKYRVGIGNPIGIL